jgi:hypothetical protein
MVCFLSKVMLEIVAVARSLALDVCWLGAGSENLNECLCIMCLEVVRRKYLYPFEPRIYSK